MTRYNVGATFERRVRKYLEWHDYLVKRSAGSRGKADLIVIAPGPWVGLVQCKKDAKLSAQEREDLVIEAIAFNCDPILAYQDKKEICFLKLNNDGASPTPWFPWDMI